MELPKAFTQNISEFLKNETSDLISAMNESPHRALRITIAKMKKTSVDMDSHVRSTLPAYIQEKVKWCPTGWYYDGEPGKDPLHEAGLYYIQEPSAMGAAELLNPKSGERVLDLCAAPGGKATRLAEKVPDGFVMANEAVLLRARTLRSNFERLGIKNGIITSERPDRLAAQFKGIFDAVLVDAPCSGEGMFRKDPDSVAQWSMQLVESCAHRQRLILQSAAELVRPGGRLVYSTCTFSRQENEENIEWFLKEYKDFSLGNMGGFPGWQLGDFGLRLWPHLQRGEGHFMCLLVKNGNETQPLPTEKQQQPDKEQRKILGDFFANTGIEMELSDYSGADEITIPAAHLDLRGIKVLRNGLALGKVEKGRFEPAHALSHACDMRDKISFLSRERDHDDVAKYLKGESIRVDGGKGWTLFCVEGYPLGWGKISDGQLKNHYPKGLRRG